MERITTKSVTRTFRVPSFLDDQVVDRAKGLPNVRNVSEAYRYFIELGVFTYDSRKKLEADPERKKQANDLIHFVAKQNDILDAIKELPQNQQRALVMAVKFGGLDSV